MFAELSRETRTLVQQEIQLARTELTEKASKMGKGAAETTQPGKTGASIRMRISNGSPSCARVDGTKPKSNGKTAPAGSTPFSTKVPYRGSKASLFGEPLGSLDHDDEAILIESRKAI
jgi:hypothetical protein